MRTWLGIVAGVLVSLLPTAGWAQGWHGRVLRPSSLSEIPFDLMADEVSRARYVVLSEKHNTPAVQEAQARVLEAVTASIGDSGFTLAWEFLDYSARARVASAWSDFVGGRIDGRGFLLRVHGHDRNSSYLPLLESTRIMGGDLLPVNLSREEKAPIVRGGLAAADPALIPPGFAHGGPLYFERFAAAMSGHASPEQIRNYYDAQCLTDDVMALHLAGDSSGAIAFLVAGSFHGDYFDGTAARLRVRVGAGERVAVVRFVDASDFTEEQILDLLHHPRYGAVADFAIFVNEPRGN